MSDIVYVIAIHGDAITIFQQWGNKYPLHREISRYFPRKVVSSYPLNHSLIQSFDPSMTKGLIYIPRTFTCGEVWQIFLNH